MKCYRNITTDEVVYKEDAEEYVLNELGLTVTPKGKNGEMTQLQLENIEETISWFFSGNWTEEEIYNNIFISYDEAVKIVKTAINELCRKQGIVVSDLSLKINQEIWCSLEELNLQQLKRLEYELSKINNKTHKWHELYNQNSKIKIVVPENQEVVYKSSHYMFGQEALKQAGDDELLRGQIIDSYLELGTDLTKVIE